MLSAAPAVASESAFSPEVGIALVFILVLANGFFVAAEFGLVAVRRSRIDQLAA
jgi:CBS domain containing-hemolysin-like protein